MTIPDFQSIMLPFLQVLADGQERSMKEMVELLAGHFSLTESELEEMLPSGQQSLFSNRVAWSKTHLKNAGLDGIIGKRRVQVKATQGRSIAISSEPDYLLVFKLARDGSFSEVYNGPGSPVWTLVSHKPVPKNGQYQVSLFQLGKLIPSIPDAQRIRRIDAS